MRRWIGRFLRVGALAAIGYAIVRAYQGSRVDTAAPGGGWQASPFPFPPVPATEGEQHAHVPSEVPPGGGPEGDVPAGPGDEQPAGVGRAWVEPVGDACPASHPVKVKAASGIYHVPGTANYDRTHPDRCYESEAAAEADGFRGAKH